MRPATRRADVQESPDDLDPGLRWLRQDAEAAGLRLPHPQTLHTLQFFARTVAALRVFVAGDRMGYATAGFAQVVGPLGAVWSTERDPLLREGAQRALARMGLTDRCRFLTGAAESHLSVAVGAFDAVFVDDEREPANALWHLASTKLRPGGVLLALLRPREGSRLGGSRRVGHRQAETLPRVAHLESISLPIEAGLVVGRLRNPNEEL